MGKKKANKAQPGQRESAEQGPVGAEPANTVEDSPLEQRTELIKEYLSRQLCQPLVPGDAATPAGRAGSQAASTQSPGSAADGSPAGGVPGDAGSSAAGAAEVGLTASALLQRVTAAACLRQAELKPALAAHLASTQIGKDKAEQLVELQQQLGKQQAPVAYQRLSALLRPGKRAPVLSTDVARFDGALSKEVLDSTALKDLARTLQSDPRSAFSAVVAACRHMKIHIHAEDVFARKGLWKKALPSVSELRPCPEEAGGAGAGRPALELGSLGLLICREAASLAYASPAGRQRGQQAGIGSDDLEEESEQPWQASLLPEGERYLRRLLKGLDLADSVLATGDPSVATFQTFHAPTFNRRSWHVAQALRCFLRGHLLMRLQQQAAAAGVQGNSPQAQDMVRPLQLLLDRPKVPLRDLLAAACAQAGAPGSSCQLQLAAALLRTASQQAKRGLLWRPAALLLLLLQQEQQAAVGMAPVEGFEGMAAVLDQLDAAGMDEAAGALFPEAEQAALRFKLASLRHADELATPALRRSLAEGVLLALQRMQQRERLTTQLVDALAACSALQSVSSDRGVPDFKKLTEVPPDQLLMLYCTVAIAFGCAFQTPADLGPTPSSGGAPSAPPGADFAAAGAVARAGLSWETDPASSPDGAQLRLNAHAVQSALHQVAQGSEKQPEHCAAGWCSDCHTVVADPSADPSDVLTAVAGLAAGSLSMPGSSLGAGVGSAGGWQDAALQIHGALLGVPAAGENQVLLSRLPVDPGQGVRLARLLCLMGSICFVALEVLKECMFRHLEALVAVHSIVQAVQDGAALKGLPGRLRELAERALLLGEFEQMAAAARRLLTHVDTLGGMSRWHASEDEMQAMLSSPGSEASLYAGWLHRCLAEERAWLNQEMAHLSSLLEPSEGAAKWPKALSVSLSVLAAKMESHMRDCSPGELFFPDPGLATALVQGAARVRGARALFDNAFDGLRGAGDALFWRCKDVLGQLRQACAVQLLAPFEELAVQRVLGARWEAEAGGVPLVAAESAVSDVTAAERAAAEAAAELEQEEAEARAAAQRRQQKQLAKQRAAEQRRLQQLEEEWARRRREEEERARQAQEEARRLAEAEAAAAAAREEGFWQRRQFLMSLKQADEAGQAEKVAEVAEERGGSGSVGPAQGSGADVARGERARHRRARGGRAQSLKEEDIQAAAAAAATAAAAKKPQEVSAGLQQPALAQQHPTGAAPARASAATKAPKAVEQPQQHAAEPASVSRRRHQVILVRGRQQPGAQQVAAPAAPSEQQATPKVAPAGQQAAPKVAPAAQGQAAASAGQQPPAAQGVPASGQEQMPPAVKAELGARSGDQEQRGRKQGSRQLPRSLQQPGAQQHGHQLPGGETLQTLEHVAQAAVPLTAAASVSASVASAAGSTAPGGAGTAAKPPATATSGSGSSAAQQANLESIQGAAARPHIEVAPAPYPATAPAQQQHALPAQQHQQPWVDATAQREALLADLPSQQAGTVPPPVSAAQGIYGLPPPQAPQAQVPHGAAVGAPPLPAWPHHAVHPGPSQALVWGTGLYGQGMYMPAAATVPPTAHAQHAHHAQHAQQPWYHQHTWHAQQAPQAAPGGAALGPAPAVASDAKPWAEQAAQWVAPAPGPPQATERARAPSAVPSAAQPEKEAPRTPPPDTAAAPLRVPSPATEQAASPAAGGAASPTADRAPSPAAASGPAAAPAAAPEPAPALVASEAVSAGPAAAGPRSGTWADLAADRPQAAARPHQEQQQQQQQPRGTSAEAPPASQRQPGKDEPAPPGPAGGAAKSGSRPAAAAAAAAKPPRAAGTRAEAAPGGQAPAAPQPPRLSFLAALAPDQAEVAALALPGLRNEAGEFNCFLNVVVQCLWRCRAFREAVLSWGPEVHAADAVLSALHSLLSELSALDFARQDAAAAVATGTSGRRNGRPVIDTTPLREALNALPGQEFKIGEMSDAGELLLVLYEHIKEAAPGPPAAQLDAAFGLHVREAVRCPKCPKTTQEQSYTQYLCNMSAAALRTSLRVSDPGFGARLRAIEDEHQKSCDTDVGGCGALYPVSHSLEGAPPRVFTLQLAWESHSEEPSAIAATMRAVGEQVDLRQLYEGVPPGTASRYRLRAMVCYYLRHYSAFVRLPELGGRWVMFDDASASAVGSWAEVRLRCEGGRVQPSVLFYEAAA